MSKKLICARKRALLALFAVICLGVATSCQKEKYDKNMISHFRDYHVQEWKNKVYTDAIYSFASYNLDEFLSEHGRNATYEVWQSQAKTGSIYTYTKLTGVDTERYHYNVWNRWIFEDEVWCYVGQNEPNPYENVILRTSFSIEIPQLTIPQHLVDEPTYHVMVSLLEQHYEDNDLAKVAFLNTYEQYAIVVLKKMSEQLTEYDDYEVWFLYMDYEEDNSSQMHLKLSSQYGIEYHNRSMLDLCGDVARCNAVYPLK